LPMCDIVDMGVACEECVRVNDSCSSAAVAAAAAAAAAERFDGCWECSSHSMQHTACLARQQTRDTSTRVRVRAFAASDCLCTAQQRLGDCVVCQCIISTKGRANMRVCVQICVCVCVEGGGGCTCAGGVQELELTHVHRHTLRGPCPQHRAQPVALTAFSGQARQRQRSHSASSPVTRCMVRGVRAGYPSVQRCQQHVLKGGMIPLLTQ
jgi:hypothetical protein